MKFSDDCCACFAGLSTKARVEIINLLQKKDQMSVTEIADQFKLSQPTISHHLQYLKEAGLAESVKKGRKVYYSLSHKCKEGRCGLFG